MQLAQFAKKRAFTAAQIDLQRRDTPEDGREIKASDVRLGNQLDHGEGLQPLRGESTSRRPNLGSVLLCRAEAQEKHDHRKHDVEPGVGRIIRHDPKRVAGANGEAPNSNHSVNDAEDLKPHSQWSYAAHRREQEDDTRRKVNDVVRRVDVENVEQHSIRRCGWDETESSNDQEDETEDNCECFNHSDLLWLKEITLMAGALTLTRRVCSQRERRFGV